MACAAAMSAMEGMGGWEDLGLAGRLVAVLPTEAVSLTSASACMGTWAGVSFFNTVFMTQGLGMTITSQVFVKQ